MIIVLFAGREDDMALRRFARSIGLHLFHPLAKEMTAEENNEAFETGPPYQGGFLSFLPKATLHTRDDRPPYTLGEFLDPLIRYTRPYYDPPHLVAGSIHWYTDVDEFAAQTKPYFETLRRWIQKNWKKREEKWCYIGPHAERILKEENARIAYFPPNIRPRTIYTD